MTKRQREILAQMAAYFGEDRGELVYESGHGGWLGDKRVAPRTVYDLHRLMALHMVAGHIGGVERYTINETGRKLLRRPARGEANHGR
jgi:hypothetical protein